MDGILALLFRRRQSSENQLCKMGMRSIKSGDKEENPCGGRQGNQPVYVGGHIPGGI